jgi:hypothetical protein
MKSTPASRRERLTWSSSKCVDVVVVVRQEDDIASDHLQDSELQQSEVQCEFPRISFNFM